MICVLSFLIFSVLGLFSAKYRDLSRDAFECIVSSVKREPCRTGLDDRVQASLVGKALEYSPWLGRLLNSHFQALSWIFLILILVSGGLAVESGYNWAVHGSCSGPEAGTGCSINRAHGALSEVPDLRYNGSVIGEGLVPRGDES